MKSHLLGMLAVGFIISGGCSKQGAPGSEVLAADLQDAQPSAPMVACTIRMNFWCIVQADAGISMIDSGEFRIWKISAPESAEEVVTIRESKSCDSSAELRPMRRSQGEDKSVAGDRIHAVELSLDSEGACTLMVQYLAGSTDLAREAAQLANYRLYLCSEDSCRQPLLAIK